MSKKKKIGLIVVGVIVILCVIGFMMQNESINTVKEGKLNDYQSKTVGEAFDNFFSDTNWDWEEEKNGYDIVIFTGECQYMDEDVDATIKFRVNTDKGTFELTGLEFDDVSQDDSMLNALLAKVYE